MIPHHMNMTTYSIILRSEVLFLISLFDFCRFISWRDFDYKFKDILDFQLRKKCIMVKGFPDVEVSYSIIFVKPALFISIIYTII